MKDKRCFICKYQGKICVETTSSLIYGRREQHLSILLCYGHSVELFKTGQSNFMLKYKPTFSDMYGFEEDHKAIAFFGPR